MSSNAKKQIPFSPPDITQAEIDQVVEALKSGWITTGPKTKQFENELSAYMGTPKTAALSSATAAEEWITKRSPKPSRPKPRPSFPSTLAAR